MKAEATTSAYRELGWFISFLYLWLGGMPVLLACPWWRHFCTASLHLEWRNILFTLGVYKLSLSLYQQWLLPSALISSYKNDSWGYYQCLKRDRVVFQLSLLLVGQHDGAVSLPSWGYYQCLKRDRVVPRLSLRLVGRHDGAVSLPQVTSFLPS
jgi:hypothetical protein